MSIKNVKIGIFFYSIQIVQIWVIFTHLKLWVEVARQLQVGGNVNAFT